jgi:hypothetical protein
VSDPRCADASAAAGESLAGTAVTVENWLLVERTGTWPRDVSAALAEDEPGSEVLRAWLDRTPSSRLLFIRSPRAAPGRRVVFVVHSAESTSSARRITLGGLEELADVDLARDGEPFASPLVLVCGHGTRDACCALRGNAVHAELAARVPSASLWISSHQGGHRFAANVLVLPSGIQLGRVAREDAVSIVDDACAGRISLAHYRGRTTYPAHVQAAEAAVREAAGLRVVGDLTLAGDHGTRVELRSWDAKTFTVAVEQLPGPTLPASCGAAPEPQSSFSARLV